MGRRKITSQTSLELEELTSTSTWLEQRPCLRLPNCVLEVYFLWQRAGHGTFVWRGGGFERKPNALTPMIVMHGCRDLIESIVEVTLFVRTLGVNR